MEIKEEKSSLLKRRCKWFYVCPMRELEKQGLIGEEWREKYCLGDFEKCVRYQMEERGEPHSDYMLPNGKILRKKDTKHT